MNRLCKDFYTRDAVTVAKALLGKWLCRRMDNGDIIRLRITETEAYFGEEDTACHAHKGRTPRTDVMYAEGGCAYVYLCYGMYDMLNVVTGPLDHAEAVLIRGVEGYDGPGKLTKALKITRDLNREDFISSQRLWLEDNEQTSKFVSGPRVGIAYASKCDRDRKWRFTVDGAFVTFLNDETIS